MMSLVAFLVSAGLTPYLIRRISENYRAAKARKAEMDAIVNTKTLVVGQDVYIVCGHRVYGYEKGKVVKVTPSGVEVRTAGELLRIDTNNIPVFIAGQTTLVVGQDVAVAYSQRKDREGKVVKVTPTGVEVQVTDLMRFDNDGYEVDDCRRDRIGFGPSPEDKFHTSLWQSAPEFGPWHLDDMPFAERKHLVDNQFFGSSLLGEIYKLAHHCSSIPNVISPSFQKVETDNGLVYAFSLRASYAPEDDDLIEVTDEELLKRLRSIKGQYFSGDFPVFYYDLLSGQPGDSSVHRTGILNLPSGKYGIIGDELTSEQIFALTARCANCRYMRIAHNPDDQKYAWYRRKDMCEHFEEPPAEENEARRKEWFPKRTK
jgi:hypothetical protein